MSQTLFSVDGDDDNSVDGDGITHYHDKRLLHTTAFTATSNFLEDLTDKRMYTTSYHPKLSNEIIRLKHNDPTLDTLTFSEWGRGFDIHAWKRLGAFLKTNTHLKELSISCCRLERNSFGRLCEGLKYNTSVQVIQLRHSHRLEVASVNGLEQVIQNNPSLRKLDLSDCSLDADGVEAIADALCSHECALQELHLVKMDIGKRGDEILASIVKILKNPLSHLRVVCIDKNPIDCNSAFALAGSLINNTDLETLCLDINLNHPSDPFVESGLIHFLHLVCDPSSIEATFDSNHTLSSLGFANLRNMESGVDDANLLCRALRVNGRIEDKLLAARMKIVLCHVLQRINFAEFALMDACILPRVLELVDNTLVKVGEADIVPITQMERLSASYIVLKNMPQVCGR